MLRVESFGQMLVPPVSICFMRSWNPQVRCGESRRILSLFVCRELAMTPTTIVVVGHGRAIRARIVTALSQPVWRLGEICRHATASAMNLLSGKWELDVTQRVTTKGGHTNPVQYDWSIWRGLIFNWNNNSFIFLATWWSDGRLRRRILALLLS